MHQKLTFKQSLCWIFLSVLLVNGLAGAGIFYYRYIRALRSESEQYRIVAIYQKSQGYQALKTVYLAELMGLSLDRPTNIYRFDTRQATSMLLKSPLIKQAVVKKIKPGTVFVEYSLRRPIAFLKDLSPALVDKEGVIFPYRPFFTPKKLTEIYLGMFADSALLPDWGTRLNDRKWQLAYECFAFLKEAAAEKKATILRIDVSSAFTESLGSREIVVEMESPEWIKSDGKGVALEVVKILRLNPESYREGIESYYRLQESSAWSQRIVDGAQDQKIIVDLRLQHLAFIEKTG